MGLARVCMMILAFTDGELGVQGTYPGVASVDFFKL
jgi:hypothetical protein